MSLPLLRRVIARLIQERDEARGELSNARERILAEAAAAKREAEATTEQAPAKRAKIPEISQA